MQVAGNFSVLFKLISRKRFQASLLRKAFLVENIRDNINMSEFHTDCRITVLIVLAVCNDYQSLSSLDSL